MKKNREQRRLKKETKTNIEEDTTENADKPKTKKSRTKMASIFDEQGKPLSLVEMARRRKAERLRKEQEMCLVTKALFDKIDTLDKQIGPAVRGVEKPLMREYIKTAHELWEDISSVNAFHPNKVVSKASDMLKNMLIFCTEN
jgi:hypothetical protein